jgi:hypothetical protein
MWPVRRDRFPYHPAILLTGDPTPGTDLFFPISRKEAHDACSQIRMRIDVFRRALFQPAEQCERVDERIALRPAFEVPGANGLRTRLSARARRFNQDNEFRPYMLHTRSFQQTRREKGRIRVGHCAQVLQRIRSEQLMEFMTEPYRRRKHQRRERDQRSVATTVPYHPTIVVRTIIYARQPSWHVQRIKYRGCRAQGPDITPEVTEQESMQRPRRKR